MPPVFWRSVLAAAVLINAGALISGSTMFPGVLSGTRFMIERRDLSYDDKMALRFPDAYDAIRFIAAHTDPRASVLLPPALHQGAVTFYLLYPRGVDSHRDPFLWGRTPVGTYAYVEGTWPDSVTSAVRESSELVFADGKRFLIKRVKAGTPGEAAQ